MSAINTSTKSFYFTPETILPTQSFTGRLLHAAANSDLLNPPNNTVNTSLDKWVNKPLRFVGRIIYLLFVSIIAAPIGTVTNLSASCCYGALFLIGRVKKNNFMAEKNQAYAWEHLKSAGFDFLSSLGIVTLGFIDEPNKVVHTWMSGTMVLVENGDCPELMRFDGYIYAKLQYREHRKSLFSKETPNCCYAY